MGWREWMSGAWRDWRSALPQCTDAFCRRTSRAQIWGKRGGIELQGIWYCSPQCFERAVERQFVRASVARFPTPGPQHRVPLGLLLLARGELSNGQLRRALDLQRTQGRGRIGHWLEQLGFATEQQVTVALGLQWACPVLPAGVAHDPECCRLLPFCLLLQARLLPIHFSAGPRVLHVAFADGIDYTVLYAIEQMLDCHTEPCLIGERAIVQELERIGQRPRPGELRFEGWRDAHEMARITGGYALKLGARRVRAAACGEHLWVRLESEKETSDLWFGRPGREKNLHSGDQPRAANSGPIT